MSRTEIIPKCHKIIDEITESTAQFMKKNDEEFACTIGHIEYH